MEISETITLGIILIFFALIGIFAWNLFSANLMSILIKIFLFLAAVVFIIGLSWGIYLFGKGLIKRLKAIRLVKVSELLMPK